MSDTKALAQNAAAAPAAGSQPEKSCECPRRKVNVDLKYRRFRHPGDVGHSWFERGNQSVGWYPSASSWRIGALTSTTGAVNRGKAQDEHHGDKPDAYYDLYTRDGDCRTDDEIFACIRKYYYDKQARGERYSIAHWDVCHTVANEAAAHCKLTQQER